MRRGWCTCAFACSLVFGQVPNADDAAWQKAMWEARELHQRGMFAEAARKAAAAAAASEKFDPADHRTVLSLSSLGAEFLDLGRFAEAERLLWRSLRTLDNHHPNLAAVRLATVANLATLYLTLRQYDRAETLLLRYLPPNGGAAAGLAETGFLRCNLGTAQLSLGRPREAEASYRQAVAILEKHPGHESDLVAPYTGLSLALLKSGRYREALEHAEESLSLCRRGRREGHPEAAGILLTLSRVYAKTRQDVKAVDCARQAVEIARKSLGAEHLTVGLALAEYASVLNRTGQKEEARAAKRESQAIFAKVGADYRAQSTLDAGEVAAIKGWRR